MAKAFYKSGALMASERIDGLTNGPLEGETAIYYGGQWMICETISELGAKRIADALRLEWTETETENNASGETI